MGALLCQEEEEANIQHLWALLEVQP